MTYDRDPPRLRTLEHELPSELSLALRDSAEENATPLELARLAERVQAEIAEAGQRSLPRPGKTARVRTARGRAAAIAFTFTLGAAAGVIGSSAAFFVLQPQPARPAPSSAPSAHHPVSKLAPAPARPALSAAPASPPEDSAAPAAHEGAPAPSRGFPVESEVAADASSNPPTLGTRDELALLARAQAAVASNPGLALALTSDHERKFPNGVLVQEREVVAIDALLRLGRRAEATGRAMRFHQQFPSSVHGRRVDVLLGNSADAPSEPN